MEPLPLRSALLCTPPALLRTPPHSSAPSAPELRECGEAKQSTRLSKHKKSGGRAGRGSGDHETHETGASTSDSVEPFLSALASLSDLLIQEQKFLFWRKTPVKCCLHELLKL